MSEQQRRTIPQEEPIQAGPIRVDYKLIWLTVLSLLSIVAVIVTSIRDIVLWGYGFCVVSFIVYVALVGIEPFEQRQTPLAAKLFRRGRNAARNANGTNHWASDWAAVGEKFGDEPSDTQRKPQFKPMGRIDFCAFPMGNNDDGTPKAPLGIGQDRREGTRSAVLWTASSSLLSVGSSDQVRRQTAFARLLDICAQSGVVHRIAWREQTFLGEPQRPSALAEEIQRAAKLQPGSAPNREVFDKRTIEMGEHSIVHRTSFVLTISVNAVRQQTRSLGSPEEVLYNLLDMFYASAMGNEGTNSPLGLRTAQFLPYNDLLMETRLAVDPVYAQPLWEGWPGPQDPTTLLSPAFAWPMYADFASSPDWGRVGDTYHVGRFLSDYNPRGMLPKEYWDILATRVPKTVTTVVQLLPQRHAIRRAKWAANSAVATDSSAALRVSASAEAHTERTEQHEREIARRIGQVGRLRSYIDCTGSTPEQAMQGAADVTKAATNGGFTTIPMTGRQLESIEAAAPFGRGLAVLNVPSWA